MMDSKEAAAALNGNEYGSEGNYDLFKDMKANGLVAVFGASDDLMEFRGAIYDEVGCYDGGTAYITPNGLFSATCKNDDCPHEQQYRDLCATINAKWCETKDISWSYETIIPHETFLIMEGGEIYCRGIVFNLGDVP